MEKVENRKKVVEIEEKKESDSQSDEQYSEDEKSSASDPD